MSEPTSDPPVDPATTPSEEHSEDDPRASAELRVCGYCDQPRSMNARDARCGFPSNHAAIGATAAGQFQRDHERDMADPEYADAYRKAASEMARKRVATAVCAHCNMEIYQDTAGTWRHDSDDKVRCLPTPPGAAPLPKTITAVSDD